MSIVALVLSAMAWRVLNLNTVETTIRLQPYQRLDSTLASEQQLVYRTLIAAVPDIVELRAEEGQWPEAGLLDDALVAPFATTLMPAPARDLQWVSYDGGSWVDYLGGMQSSTEQLTYLLRLIDVHAGYHPHPHPGVDYDPNQAIAVQVWVFDQAGRAYPGERLPEAGWFWLLNRSDPLLARQARPGFSIDAGSADGATP
ncbi:hypothetical protein [Thiosocius teredinicola]|uniref:hypothetical protein n=1 Tax=Thiosocius teredinicola TaxID=1973002 RepID=UPI0013DDCF2F